MIAPLPDVTEEVIEAAAVAADRDGLLAHFSCDDYCAKRGMELEAVANIVAAVAPLILRGRTGAQR